MQERLNSEYIKIKNKHRLDQMVDACKYSRSKYACIIRDMIERWGGPIPPQAWFDLAVESLMANERTRGQVWKTYARTGKLAFTDISGVIRAYLRHEKSNYNNLLGWGFTREQARFYMREPDSEKVG